MELLRFRLRSDNRDRQSDVRRFDRLRKVAVELIDDIERERTGLELRYRNAVADAAFSFDAMENGGDASAAGRVDALTGVLVSTRTRVAVLGAQADFLRTVLRDATVVVSTPTSERGDA